jgi:hypothetical protein
MKQNFTYKAIILSGIIFLLSQAAQAQPDYDFRNPVLISGTGYNVGAQYRFSDTKPGIDAIVTITNYSGGLVLNNIDGGSGFVEAFQPVINIPAFSSGYIDFTIEFVVGGTLTPMIQAEVPATPIDVDGQTYASGNVYESDEFDMGPGGYVNYDMMGNEITVTQAGSLVTGNNIAAIDYPGVDTVARQVMFTVVNSNISTFYYRVGGTNNSNASRQRLRSVYFKKFWYNNALMSIGSLQNFAGVSREANVQLNWSLSAKSNVVSVNVERSSEGRNFTKIADLSVGNNDITVKQQYTDINISSVNYYRLKLTYADGYVKYSNVLVFNNKINSVKTFKVYPNIIQSDANINIVADARQQATISIYDFSGRMMKHESIHVEQGMNSIHVNDLSGLVTGNYVLVMNIGNDRFSQQVVKR